MTALHIPQPSPRQLQFMTDGHKYLAFGGARGGGKSWAARVKAVLMCLQYPGIIVMIVRRSYPELQANHIGPLRAILGTRCGRYIEQSKTYRFTNGSVIMFRYCETSRDMERYQGVEADVIIIDEATQLDEAVFDMFCACLRGVNAYPKRILLTCNPGGRGHGWVKRRFIDRAFKSGERPEDYGFIQSLVTDNLALMKAQPEYVQQLDALPERMRKAWRYGDWDVFEGQFFEEFTDDPAHYDDQRFTHVIAPFPPPKEWKRFRSFDWGFGKPFSCGWWAVDTEGTLYRIAELYGCTDEPDTGLKWPANKVFSEIARIEHEHPYLRGKHVEGVADPAIWDGSGDEHGVSIADMAARKGLYFEPGNHARIPGWMQMHYRMAFAEDGRPRLYVFSTCKAFIRTVPLLVYSDTRPEDVDTKQEDHVADETRYFCMRNPVNPPKAPAARPRPYNPLDTADDEADRQDRYRFYRL